MKNKDKAKKGDCKGVKMEVKSVRKGERKERIMAYEQVPDVELKFPVSGFSMLNTSWITHHYPTALALRAALSLSLPPSHSVFDAS